MGSDFRARFFGIALAIPSVVLVGMGVAVGFSLSGWLLSLVAALFIVGLAGVQSSRRARMRAGLGLLILVVAGRIIAAGHGDMRMMTLPGSAGSRWLGRIIDEQDGSLVGARLLLWFRPAKLTRDERRDLLPAMHDAFVEMHHTDGTTASPVLDTLAGRQSPAAFDTVVIEPHGRSADTAVIFLHGFAGNFTLACWMVAEAARAIDAVTVCPSTNFAGRWWSAEGEKTVRATLDYMHGRGIHHVFLAGLSNGGMGAAILAPRLARSLDVLVLISGVSDSGSGGGLPTLIIQGEHDPMASAGSARLFASRAHATYKGYDAGHFVLLTHRTEVRTVIGDWLKKRVGR